MLLANLGDIMFLDSDVLGMILLLLLFPLLKFKLLLLCGVIDLLLLLLP